LDTDLLVIGTGGAGMAAAIHGAELGARVTIVERGPVGGTCENVGRISSKNLIAAAEHLHRARRGFPGITPVERSFAARPGSRRTAASRWTGRRPRARGIVLATGASSWVPPIAGLEEAGYLDSASIMDIGEVPDSLVVLGASAVGLELGQTFARLGASVTV
jgi:mercuric reductase